MKKNYEIRFKVSKEEKQKIEKKARLVGMTSSSFCRTLALISNINTT